MPQPAGCRTWAATGGPARLPLEPSDYPFVGRLVGCKIPRGNAFIDELYDYHNEAEMLHSTILARRRKHDFYAARELAKDNREFLRMRKTLNVLVKRLSRINVQLRKVTDHPTMSSEEKFRRTQQAVREKNRIGRRFERMLERLE